MKKTVKKIELNKMTIANLNIQSMNQVEGGIRKTGGIKSSAISGNGCATCVNPQC